MSITKLYAVVLWVICIHFLQVNKYLEKRPCAEQNSKKIKEYLVKLKHMPIRLTKKEKLMLVNDPPDSVLQLSLVHI